MLRIDRKDKSLKLLSSSSLIEAGLKERVDIQEMINNFPEPFFTEMGESLFLLGKEVCPTDFVADRIDLLAIDPQGNSVVIEIKRGPNKLHLLQGLTYASMIAKWDSARLIEECSQQCSQTIEEVEERIEGFLDVELDNLNESQRVILLADAFDYEVLVAAEWLNERYEVDIKCYRLSLSIEGENEFLTCTCIYPAPELTAHAERRKGPSRPLKWSDWESALGTITNKEVSDFFREELAKGRQGYLRKKQLHYRLNGKKRWNVHARQEHAYVWQIGRFEEDQEFWSRKIGSHIDVKPVRKSKQSLRFILSSAEDFGKFLDAVQNDLKNEMFTYAAEDLDEENNE